MSVKEKARENKEINKLLTEYAKSAVVLNVLSDPLGHECFRIPPFYRLAYFLEKICLLVIIALAILANIKINIPAHFIVITVFFSILFWALINYVWLCVPAGLLAFMRPGLKKGTWYIGMGHLAWTIYNRSMLRREFILNDLARILRTVFFDRRINTIATTTWLFEPDNIPQNIPPPTKKIKLKGLPRIIKAFTTYIYHQLANMNYHRSKPGIGKQSPLTSA